MKIKVRLSKSDFLINQIECVQKRKSEKFTVVLRFIFSAKCWILENTPFQETIF